MTIDALKPIEHDKTDRNELRNSRPLIPIPEQRERTRVTGATRTVQMRGGEEFPTEA
jgi:hypothetical protein